MQSRTVNAMLVGPARPGLIPLEMIEVLGKDHPGPLNPGAPPTAYTVEGEALATTKATGGSALRPRSLKSAPETDSLSEGFSRSHAALPSLLPLDCRCRG